MMHPGAPFPLCHVSTQRADSWQAAGLTRQSIRQHLDLGLPDSRAMRNKFRLFRSHRVYGILLELPRWTKTVGKSLAF